MSEKRKYYKWFCTGCSDAKCEVTTLKEDKVKFCPIDGEEVWGNWILMHNQGGTKNETNEQ